MCVCVFVRVFCVVLLVCDVFAVVVLNCVLFPELTHRCRVVLPAPRASTSMYVCLHSGKYC